MPRGRRRGRRRVDLVRSRNRSLQHLVLAALILGMMLAFWQELAQGAAGCVKTLTGAPAVTSVDAPRVPPASSPREGDDATGAPEPRHDAPTAPGTTRVRIVPRHGEGVAP